jgi:LysM repeat protein
MKKSVQALIKRRRARLIPVVLAGLAGLILLAFVLLVFNFFSSGPGVALFRSPTPTPSATGTPTSTETPAPATPTPLASDTPTFTPGPSPTPSPITYTVQEGDTLFGIATSFLDQGFFVDVEAIRLFNNLTGDALSVGQVLTIPLGNEVQTATPSPLPTGLGRGARIQYTVLLGDTLELIAAKFNSTAEDIALQNRTGNQNLTNDRLQAGAVIVVRINLVTPTLTPVPSRTP